MKKIILACLAYYVVIYNANATVIAPSPDSVFSLSSFNTEVTGATITTETFDNNIAAAETITFDSGVTSTLSGGNIAAALLFGDNQVTSGLFIGSVDSNGFQGAELLTLTFPEPIIGFSGDFNNFLNLSFSLDGGVSFTNFTFSPGDFFGLVNSTAFSSVVLSSPGTRFSLDNLVFATPVPIPAAVWLMGSALVGLVGVARRRS